ncbi:tellurite resistance protein [Cohnella sp. OV330]|uniref:SLAC1 anion channel family protein n=1 Tax=Cohnella sp. OV330 TaxID=1855288 RepID=UPI0008E7CCD3|nr:SLAC1 anion channel family protein [Cohnella sp. OV330]SFB44961.1 tellurite resistance protein [Cohnella sp. OV330]
MRTLTADIKLSTVGSIQFLPVNLFASVMGFSGLALAWREAHKLFGTSDVIADVSGMVAVVLFITLSIAYLSKWVLYPEKVKAEFLHPVFGHFFGTITISILLLSSVIGSYSSTAGQAIWILGAATTIALSYVFVARLLNGNRDPGHTVPAMLVPVVGTLDIAVAGGTMPFPWAHEINLLSLAIGGMVALAFFIIILSRLIHDAPLPAGITPSLLILIAPFEVGFLGYTNVERRIDSFASVLFYFGLFLFVVLFFKVFKRTVPFGASWWGVSFPMAALSIAALKYALFMRTWPLTTISAIVLALFTIVMVVLFFRTLRMLLDGKLLSGK